MRSALVDYFREEGRIMIATEAGAEGINLQFCSLVVNYDLPWNPQRIEQRIGRCHRYGQKHDVVVVNFLNRKNAADKRVYELLSEKFKLFEGVFGASDEVLGAIESGVDFEKRINAIYQRCRKTEDIKIAFDELQLELSWEINEAMTVTRKKLLEKEQTISSMQKQIEELKRRAEQGSQQAQGEVQELELEGLRLIGFRISSPIQQHFCQRQEPVVDRDLEGALAPGLLTGRKIQWRPGIDPFLDGFQVTGTRIADDREKLLHGPGGLVFHARRSCPSWPRVKGRESHDMAAI